MSQQNQTFRVTLTAALQANNPIEAAHLFSQAVGQSGFDKFQVTDAEGELNIVDINLLVKMGILTIEPPKAEGQDQADEESVAEVVTEAEPA